MQKTAHKNIKTARRGISDFEELLPEEEAAIETGRHAYANGEWVSLSKVKNGMGRSSHKARAKKS